MNYKKSVHFVPSPWPLIATALNPYIAHQNQISSSHQCPSHPSISEQKIKRLLPALLASPPAAPYEDRRSIRPTPRYLSLCMSPIYGTSPPNPPSLSHRLSNRPSSSLFLSTTKQRMPSYIRSTCSLHIPPSCVAYAQNPFPVALYLAC